MLLFLTYLKSENICTKRYFTAEKNAENMMEITIQGDLVHDLAEACNALYDVRVVVSR